MQWRPRRSEVMLDESDINVAQEIWRKDGETWDTSYRFGELRPENMMGLEIRSSKANMNLVQGMNKKAIDSDMVCLHEILKVRGRVIMDLDIEGTTLEALYEMYPPDDKMVPMGLTKAIERLLVEALNDLDRDKAEIMMQRMVQWDTYGWASNARPYCWTHACRKGKVSMHLTIPIFLDDLPMGLKILYTLMNDKARNDGAFSWLEGKSLMDMALCGRHHQLRLPWQAKRESRDGTGCIHRYLEKGYGWLHAVSGLDPMDVPGEYHLEVEKMMLHPMLGLVLKPKMACYDATGVQVSKEEVESMLMDAEVDLDGRGYDGVEPWPRSYPTHVGWRLRPRGPQDCPCCRRVHEHTTNTPIVCASASRYYLWCYQRMGTPGHTVTLRLRMGDEALVAGPEIGYGVTLYSPLEGSTTFSMNLRESMSQVSTEDIDRRTHKNAGLLLVKSAMGTGKSEMALEMIRSVDRNQRILILSTRVAHAKDMWKKYKDEGFMLYNSCHGWSRAPRLIVELESLHKVEVGSYHMVLLDESMTIMKLFRSATMEEKVEATWAKLKHYMIQARKVVCMDAFMTQDQVQILKYILRYKTCYEIINSFKPADRCPKLVHKYKTEEEFNGRFLQDCGRRILVTSSAGYAGRVARALHLMGVNVVLNIGKDKRAKIIREYGLPPEMVPDPDASQWTKYDVVINTPAVMNGISFTENYFNTLYVYSSNHGCDPHDILQMCCRSRVFSDDAIYWYHSRKGKPHFGPIAPHDLLASLEAQEKAWNVHLQKDRPSLIACCNTCDKDLQYILAFAEMRYNAGRRYMEPILHHLLEHEMGYEVEQDCWSQPLTLSKQGKIPLPMIQAQPKEIQEVLQKDKDIFYTCVDQAWGGAEDVYNKHWFRGGEPQQNVEDICRAFQVATYEARLEDLETRLKEPKLDPYESTALQEKVKVVKDRLGKRETRRSRAKLTYWKDILRIGRATMEGQVLTLTFNTRTRDTKEWKELVTRIVTLWPEHARGLDGRKCWEALVKWFKQGWMVPQVDLEVSKTRDFNYYMVRLHLEEWIGNHISIR